MPPTSWTPASYRNELVELSTEIENLIVVHYTYEEINRLALQEEGIIQLLNRDALFWQTYMHCLQTTLFVTLSRIFDTEPNARTIHSLLNATLSNIHLFSADALSRRKTGVGSKPAWLDDFMAGAWMPTSANDLRHLKKALIPHTKRYEEIYRPIRHSIFAHRLMSNDEAGMKLFGATNRDEISTMLDFLHDLVEALADLYHNGSQPTLGKRDFSDHNQRIRDGVGEALRRQFHKD